MTSQTKTNKTYIHKLEYIIANMPGYVYWKDKHSKYMGCNNNLAKVSGLKNPSEIIGKTDYDFEWGKEQADQFVKDDREVMETRITHTSEYQLPVKRFDGNYLIVRTDKMPLYNEKGNVIGVLAIAVDVTDQKLLEKKLIREKEKAEALSQAKTEFLRNMEHDIRTPFSGIYSMTEILARQETNAEKKELLQIITQSAKELLDYCNGIVDFARLESGKWPILIKKFNFKNLLDSVITMESPPAKVKGLQLITNYHADVPQILIGDEYRVERILINLMSNAIKFTKNGFVKASVNIVKKDVKKNIILKISIQDTGIGIPKDKYVYIFGKFNRLTPSNKSPYVGSGLGLSIVKQLVEELKGKIDLISSQGKGTTFTCVIPFKIP